MSHIGKLGTGYKNPWCYERGSRSLIFNLCNAIQSVRCPALSSRRLSFQCKDFLPESLVCNFRAWGWLNRQSIIGFCYKRIAPPLSRSWFRIIHYTVLVWSTHSQTPVVISNHCGKAQHAHTLSSSPWPATCSFRLPLSGQSWGGIHSLHSSATLPNSWQNYGSPV